MTRAEFEALLAQRSKLILARKGLRSRFEQLKVQAEENPLAHYKPTTPDTCTWGDSQMEFHQALAKERLIYGANRSGKTEAGAAETAMHASGRYPDWYPREGRILDGEVDRRPLVIRCYAENYKNGVNAIMWPKLLKYLPRKLRVEPTRNAKGEVEAAHLPNGCTIYFGTYNQKESSERGTDADFVWFDEPPDSENRYLEIVRGTLDRGGRVILTLTPLDCEWLDLSILAKASDDPKQRYRPFVCYVDIRDNPYIPEDEKKWWVDRLPEDQRHTRVAGRPKSLLSTVFTVWNVDTHFIPAFPLPMKDDKPDGWCLYMTIDPHDSKPPAVVWWAVFDPAMGGGLSKVFAVREYFGPQTVIASVVQDLRDVEVEDLRWKARGRVMDPNFGAKETCLSGDSIQNEYHKASRAAKYPMVFRLGMDNQAVGHEAVAKLLGTVMPSGPWEGKPQLQVFECCPRLALAFRYYRRKDPHSEKVLDNEHKHWMDNARYFATASVRFVNEQGEQPMKVLTMIEKLAQAEREVALPRPSEVGKRLPMYGGLEEPGLSNPLTASIVRYRRLRDAGVRVPLP